MLKSLGFEEGKSWKYDPYQKIYAPRDAIKSSPYFNETNLEIERLANKESCKVDRDDKKRNQHKEGIHSNDKKA
jgi:hypothetical protein